MSKKRRKFDRDFKHQAVNLVLKDGLSQAEVSRRLGITSGLIARWVAEAQDNGLSAFPGNGKLKPQDEEIRLLQKQVRDQQLEIEFLKKTSSYFASLKK